MDAAPAAQLELPHDVALQIHRVLSETNGVAPLSPPLASTLSSSSPSSKPAPASALAPTWTPPRPLEAQVDALLSEHQPVTLTSVDLVYARLRHEIRSCQATIDRLTVQLEKETDATRMSQVQQAIAALLQQLNLIREKARESENVVKEITRDIRSLDVAKRNVVASMTALKRLQMLVNGVDQLERLTETRRYREAASALQAVKALLDFFQSYKGVERIAVAWKQVNDLQTQLRTSAMHDFEQFFLHEPGRSVRSTNLADAALALDAVGNEARNALVDWYCALQLREYRRIFRATDEAGQLDNVSRRFAWFRRVLKTHEDEHAPAFLADWHVERRLVRKFSEITKEDLQSVLIREQGRLNVGTLLEALNATLEFEAAIGRKFGTGYDDVVAPPSASSLSATATATAQQPEPSTQNGSSTSGVGHPKGQTLSSTFDPYLIVFVEAQDRTLAEMFQAYRRQGVSLSSEHGQADGRSGGAGAQGGFGADGIFGQSSSGGVDSGHGAGGGGAGTVLPSSTEMFYFYRQTLEQCARLSNREPFKELYNVYRKWLRIYADDILRTALLRNEPVRRSIDVRPNVSDVQKWCLVLNTADYCASTSSQLEDKLREKIHPDLREGVSLEEEREIFTTLISYAVQTLARELELCSESIWTGMLRPAPPSTPWTQLRQVGGPSAYVGELSSLLEQFGVVIRQETENKRFVRSWCDKVVAVVVARFTNALVRLRPISHVVAGQLLVDLGELRKRLEELPRYPTDDGWGGPPSSSSGTTTAANSYRRYVSKLIGRIEALLRVVMAPTAATAAAPSTEAPLSMDNQGNANRPDGVDPLAASTDLIDAYRHEIGDRSFSNFQKVLDLKGVRKVEANELLDRFLKDDRPSSPDRPGRERDAPPGESWLSRLDMDPPMQPVLAPPLDGTATPPGRSSLHLASSAARSNGFFSSSVLGAAEGMRSPTSGAAGMGAVPLGSGAGGQQQEGGGATSGAGRAFSEMRRFGSIFGAALGRREEGRR